MKEVIVDFEANLLLTVLPQQLGTEMISSELWRNFLRCGSGLV